MKTQILSLKLLTVLLFGGIIGFARADVTKTNNDTALNLGGSWVGGAAPTAADLAIFDSTLDGSFSSYALGGNLTVNGISFRDAASAQSITATSGSTLTLANGSLGINLTAAAYNNFSLACLVNLGTAGGQTFSVANSGLTLALSGVISGTGPLTIAGAGTVKLSGLHTYTGGTTVASGTLQLGSANTLPAGTITVQSGATLDLGAYWLTNKAYVVHIAGTGVGGVGALAYLSGGQKNWSVTNLVLDADASVGAWSRFTIQAARSGAVSLDLAGHTLTKVGGNLLGFVGFPIASGNITVETGTLLLNNNAITNTAFGQVTVKSGATFAMFRSSGAPCTVTRPITLEGGANLAYTGQQTSDAIDQSIGSAITLAGDAFVQAGGNASSAGSIFELAGPISGAYGLTLTSTNTVLLSGASTYSGATVVSAGTLALSTAWSGSGAVTVNDNAGLEARPATLNATLKLDSLTLGSAGNTTVTFNMGGFANPADTVINVTNALTLNGTTIVNLSGTTGLTNGTFTLITFGSLAGAGNFQMGLVPGFNATLTTNGNSIQVNLAAAVLAWRGAVSGDWLTTNPEIYTNWLDLLANVPAAYADGNAVVFDDSLTGTPLVNLPAPVLPISVTVSNTATTYTFSGSGKISGTTGLTKTGAGTLNLGTLNDYTGPTTIAQGKLQLGLAQAIPTNTVAVMVGTSGTLDLNGNNQIVIGLNGNGTVSNSSPTSAELRFGAGSAGTFAGVIADNGSGNLTLYKTGGGYQTLTGNNTFSGGTSMNGGSLFLGSDGALGSGPLSLAFTAQVASDSSTPRAFANALTFAGGSTKNIGDAVNNGVLTFSGTVGFSGTASGTRNVSFNSDVIFNGAVGNGPLNKAGAGKLTMDGVNTCDATTINGGTLAGSGSFSGSVAINAATLSPGTGIGTLTINNTLFLNATSSNYFELDAAGNTNDAVAGLTGVTYGGTLTVVNQSGTLANGQSFQLFNTAGAAVAGNFGLTNLPALDAGLAWNWDPGLGTLSVVPGMASNPTNLTFSVSGGNLNLTWPGDHLGWIAQSNAVALADTNYWFDIAGSDTATNLSITIDPSLTNVFYRIRKPN